VLAVVVVRLVQCGIQSMVDLVALGNPFWESKVPAPLALKVAQFERLININLKDLPREAWRACWQCDDGN